MENNYRNVQLSEKERALIRESLEQVLSVRNRLGIMESRAEIRAILSKLADFKCESGHNRAHFE